MLVFVNSAQVAMFQYRKVRLQGFNTWKNLINEAVKMSDKTIIAIMYDFDKTLTTKDQQEFTFIPDIRMSAEEFWGKSKKLFSISVAKLQWKQEKPSDVLYAVSVRSFSKAAENGQASQETAQQPIAWESP